MNDAQKIEREEKLLARAEERGDEKTAAFHAENLKALKATQPKTKKAEK